MKKILALFCVMAGVYTQQLFAQSMNCATATSLDLSSGSACANGTNAGAISDNTLYGSCNTSPVDMVWYTYVANGSNNNYTVTPGTLQNAEIVIYTGNCPNASGAQLEYCTTASGNNTLVTTWGMVAGQQVWVGVASTTLQDGTFQLCVTSTAPAPGPGNTCAQAIPICTQPYNVTTIPSNSSGLKPSCFASAPQQDIYVQFTITQSGVLAWTASCPASTEYDWALWNITNGCPGTLACCNYNYAGGSGQGFGMQNQTGTVTCGSSAISNSDPKEFCPAMNVTCGQTYAIQISNYSNNNNGFNLSFTNSTCQISSNANFSASPALVCGTSLNATITNSSTGGCAAVWDYGDGSATYTGSSPASHNYTTPGTYAITETIGGACPSTHTEFVQLLAPLSSTVSATNTGCSGCTGTASITAVSGGDGSYTYSWAPGGQTTNNLSALCAGTYTATVSNAVCGTSVSHTVTVNSVGTATMSVNSAGICGGNSAVLTANGCTSYTWSPATGLSSTSGSVVTASPGVTTTYTVIGANGTCTASATSVVTVTATPTVTVNNGVICNGGSAALTASGATNYSWSPATGLSATTGANVTATPASTTIYTITGANGTCTSTATSTVTVVSNPSVTVSSGTICLGQQTTSLTASGASTYTWSPGTGLGATTGSMVTANPGATQVYTVTGTVGTCTASGTGTVTVLPLPTITSTSGTICAGQGTTTLTANGGVTYTWNPGTGLSSTNGSTVTANPGTTSNYTVSGTDANGCMNSGTTTVVVNPLPNITLNSGSICIGGSMTLNANGATTYTWSPGTGLSATNGSSVTANPTSTTNYTVVGTNSNGCVNQDTTTVTVVSNPTITATTGTICAGQGTATLTASGGDTYTWSPSSSLSSSTGSVVTASPASTQVYTITGTLGTCTASGTTTVTVNALPNITASSNSPVCVNANLNLTAGNGVGYVWSGPNSFTSTSGNPSINGVTAAATGVYTVAGTDMNGCVNTQTTSVIINPLPVVTATGATVCLGQTAALGSLPNGGSAYSWGGPGGYTSAAQNPSISSVTQANAGNYIVTVIDPNGCVNAAVATVVVNNLPTISANSGTICAGQTSATLTATGGITYSWAQPAGLSATSGSVVVASPTTTTSYTVTGTDANGCQNTGTLTVTVNPAPTLSVVPQNASGCAPLCATFSNSTSASGTCAWSFGDGTNDAACNPHHCFNTAGSYSITLTLTDGNSCKNSASAVVNVYPIPNADFSADPQPATILEPSVQFYDATTGAIIAGWSWNFGDYLSSSNASSLSNPVHVFSDTGSFAVQLAVLSDHGCRDTTVEIIRVDDDYALYVPNAFSPNGDGTNDVFKAVGVGVKEFKMYIFDRWGNQVFFSDKLDIGWDGRFQSKGEEIVQEDVYVWKIEARNVKNEKKILSGIVNLLK
jgi:gliding motility-associated-like protein